MALFFEVTESAVCSHVIHNYAEVPVVKCIASIHPSVHYQLNYHQRENIKQMFQNL